MLRKVEELGIPRSLMELPELHERRIFVQTPGGTLLELVFRTASNPLVGCRVE